MPRPNRRPGIATTMFIAELMNLGVWKVPPVTLALIGSQFLIYFGFLDGFFHWDPRNVCIGYNAVWEKRSFLRLLTGAFVHLDEWHLYYNMTSLLWKGFHLERKKFSTPYFAAIIATFIPFCGLFTILLDYMVSELLDDYSRLYVCAAGFSSVIFALKVLLSHYEPSQTVFIMGSFPVNSRYACWFELLLIQMVTPNASFTGHLAGILVGLLFIWKPLKHLVDFVYSVLFSWLDTPGTQRRPEGPRPTNLNNEAFSSPFRTPGQRLGRGEFESSPNAYTAGLSEEDQMAWALHESIRQTPTARQWNRNPPAYGWNLNT